MFSEEIRLSNLVANLQNFKKIFEMNSKELQNFLDLSMFETETTLDVDTVEWDLNDKLITFPSNSSLLGVSEIKE